MSFYGAFFRTLLWRPRQATQALFWYISGQAPRAHHRLRASAAPSLHTGSAQGQGDNAPSSHVGAAPSAHAYQVWIDTVERREKTLAHAAQTMSGWENRPRITVLLYHEPGVSAGGFERCVTALSQQVYRDWELVLVQSHAAQPPLAIDVPRLVLAPSRATNPAQALSIGMQSATGSHIVPLGSGTRLSPTALYHFAEALQDDPEADVFYGDHDHTGMLGIRRGPWFKPAWNPAMFLSQDYISQICLIRAHHLTEALPLPPALAEAATYAVLLRAVTQTGASVVHVPHILAQISREDERETVRPESAPDTAETPDEPAPADEAIIPLPVEPTTTLPTPNFPAPPEAATAEPEPPQPSPLPIEDLPVTSARHGARLAALARHLESQGATVAPGPWGTHRIAWPLPAQPEPVSILIPAGQQAEPLRRCVLSLLNSTRYAQRHVVIASNGMPGPDMERYLTRIAQNPRVTVLRLADAPSTAALLNRAARAAQGRFLCLMSPDVEVLDDLWLTSMVRHASREGIGAVGAKLLHYDGTIRHAGLVLGLGEGAGHAHHLQPDGQPGYFAQAHVTRHATAVSGACLLVDRQAFENVGALDEDAFANAWHDVDLCLRLERAGLRNLYVPEAVLLHHDKPFTRRRVSHERELAMLRSRWGTDTFRDPLHHRYLDRQSERYTLRL